MLSITFNDIPTPYLTKLNSVFYLQLLCESIFAGKLHQFLDTVNSIQQHERSNNYDQCCSLYILFYIMFLQVRAIVTEAMCVIQSYENVLWL